MGKCLKVSGAVLLLTTILLNAVYHIPVNYDSDYSSSDTTVSFKDEIHEVCGRVQEHCSSQGLKFSDGNLFYIENKVFVYISDSAGPLQVFMQCSNHAGKEFCMDAAFSF